jgi:hypothetical protein
MNKKAGSGHEHKSMNKKAGAGHEQKKQKADACLSILCLLFNAPIPTGTCSNLPFT